MKPKIITRLDERTVATLTETKKPRILFVDLETSPILGWSWDGWETTLLEIEQDSKILCFSYKWQDEDEVHNVSLWDFNKGKKWNRYTFDDWKVVERLWHLFNEADVIVAQNGNKFDIRVANTRFLFHGLMPPTEHKDVDTLVIARRYFKMSFNNLDHLCRFLQIPRKADPGSKKTWFECMDGNEESWQRMIYYNNRDVECLVNVYDKMRGWHKTHPNLTFFTRNMACSVCLCPQLRKDGYRFNRKQKYQRWQCSKCGAGMYTRLDETPTPSEVYQ